MKKSLFILGLILLFSCAVPLFMPFSYAAIDLSMTNLPPSWKHPFGTDDLGRDLLLRIAKGGQISLFIGGVSAFLDLIIGIVYGSFAALIGRKGGELLMRLCDILYAIPSILMVMLCMTLFGTGLVSILLSLTLTGWINMARIVRNQLLEVKKRDFVLASMGMGASSFHILRCHLIPHVSGIILTQVTYSIPYAIFTESFLSFLGIGIQPPTASWGTLIAEGSYALEYFPWRLFFPSFFIAITLFALQSLGNALRDQWDPERRYG